MSVLLKPFKAKETCTKCGSKKIYRVYHRTEECYVGCGGGGGPWISKEHFLLTCFKCHFEWRSRVKQQ